MVYFMGGNPLPEQQEGNAKALSRHQRIADGLRPVVSNNEKQGIPVPGPRLSMLEKAAQRMVSVRQRLLAPPLFRRKGHDALGKIEGSVMAYGQRRQKNLGVFSRQ